jgi:hypothetical protein
MRRIVSRRICWPTPDATCLNGGCGYCNDYPFRSMRVLVAYARRTGRIHHRAAGSEDATEALQYGLVRQFLNAEVRWSKE